MVIDGVQLALFIVLWAAVLMGLGILTRRRSGARHELDPAVWLARSLVGGLFALLFVFGPYERSHALSPFLQGLNFFPFLVLTPFQTLVDPIGAFMLHRKGRHHVEQFFVWNFVVLLPYLMLPIFLVSEFLAKRREEQVQRQLEQFAESLPQWMRGTLLHLDRQYGHAKRRAELNLTRNRSRLLAGKGLAKENKDRELELTELGRVVAKILPKQARIAGREDIALRTQSGRVLGSLPGVLRRIVS